MAMTQRPKKRRDPEQRISELQAKIEAQRAKIAERERQRIAKGKLPDSIREIPKLKKKLEAFVQLAANDRRLDLMNTVTGFIASLERTHAQAVAERDARNEG
jgi:hypothetical protein